jgi:hypothetical protein
MGTAGLVAILFTDVVGSTEAVARLAGARAVGIPAVEARIDRMLV